jgi:hypothetical protein
MEFGQAAGIANSKSLPVSFRCFRDAERALKAAVESRIAATETKKG